MLQAQPIPSLRDQARQLRRHATDAEQRLWSALRRRQVLGQRFRRQHPIDCFVVDFFCPDLRLVIELDGGQHAAQAEADRSRTRVFAEHGYRVLRFWNNEVLQNLEGVLERIAEVIKASPDR